jgi:diacylglycerol kinase family enzyme
VRRVAVLLNVNARRVNAKLVAWMREQLAPGDVFVSADESEAREAARAIAAGGYGALCVGGGDGTFMRAVTDLQAAFAASRAAAAAAALPAMLALRLGTGNAICDVCGSSPPTRAGLAADLARAASDEPAVPLRLLEVDGHLAHFTGVGLDARYAEDHKRLIKRRLTGGFSRAVLGGGFGFFLAAALRTIPRLAVQKQLRLRIINEGEPAARLDRAGAPDGGAIIAAGETLYEGPITIAACSTVSHYSSGLRFFPFADALDGRVQLRVSSAGAWRVVGSLPRIFAGTYYNPKVLWDFAVTRVRFELARPAPFHIGGDVMDGTSSFGVGLSPHYVPLLRRPTA